MHEYAFDTLLVCAIRVKAKDEKSAREMLAKHLDAASANLGAWPDGNPILAEVSLDGNPQLFEINGETVDPTMTSMKARPELSPAIKIWMGTIFIAISEQEIEWVFERLTGVHPESDAAYEGCEDQLKGVGAILDTTKIQAQYADATMRSMQELLTAVIDQDRLSNMVGQT
jgi:hypothetical protein